MLLELNHGKRTPTQISKTCGLFLSAVSRALRELKRWGLVVYSEEKRGRERYYSLSKRGRDLLRQLGLKLVGGV